MGNTTILYEISADQITSQFDRLQNRLAAIEKNLNPKQLTEYLTRKEVAEMLKCDISTIHNWTKKGKLLSYAIGNRIYYKRHEIEAKLIPIGIEEIGTK